MQHKHVKMILPAEFDMSQPPPPSYTASTSTTVNLRRPGERAKFSILPTSVKLKIVLAFCDESLGEEEYTLRLWGLHRAFRGVNRECYMISMSILRSHYLDTWFTNVRPPYTSDPFPSSLSAPSYAPPTRNPSPPIKKGNNNSSTSPTSANGVQSDVFSQRSRETAIFDRFIARRLGDDLRKLESGGLSEGGDEEHDIFTRMQPQARLEDLILQYSLPTRLLTTSLLPHPPSMSDLFLPLPFSCIAIQLWPTKICLLIKCADKRAGVLLESVRTRGAGEAKLEDVARSMVGRLEGMR